MSDDPEQSSFLHYWWSPEGFDRAAVGRSLESLKRFAENDDGSSDWKVLLAHLLTPAVAVLQAVANGDYEDPKPICAEASHAIVTALDQIQVRASQRRRQRGR